MARTLLLRLALPALLGLVLLELCLRLFLFGPPALQRLAPGLQEPFLFVATDFDPDYWKLTERFRPADYGPYARDSLLGWRSPLVRADFDHDQAELLGDRRPILLFGDSFSACVTPQVDCFEGLAAQGPYRDEIAVLNYGAGGYGLDQTALCMRAALPRWVEREPIVVVGIFVGDDLNRCALELRTWLKPRFELGEGGLVLRRPPEEMTGSQWVSENPIQITSYLARWVLYGSGWFDPDRAEERRAQAASLGPLCRRLVLDVRDDLERAGVPYFFFLMPGKRDLASPDPTDWQELLLLDVLTSEGIPFESTRADLLEDIAESGRGRSEYFERGHYNALGNRVAYRAFERGVLRAAR